MIHINDMIFTVRPIFGATILGYLHASYWRQDNNQNKPRTHQNTFRKLDRQTASCQSSPRSRSMAEKLIAIIRATYSDAKCSISGRFQVESGVRSGSILPPILFSRSRNVGNVTISIVTSRRSCSRQIFYLCCYIRVVLGK